MTQKQFGDGRAGVRPCEGACRLGLSGGTKRKAASRTKRQGAERPPEVARALVRVRQIVGNETRTTACLVRWADGRFAMHTGPEYDETADVILEFVDGPGPHGHLAL